MCTSILVEFSLLLQTKCACRTEDVTIGGPQMPHTLDVPHDSTHFLFAFSQKFNFLYFNLIYIGKKVQPASATLNICIRNVDVLFQKLNPS